MDRDETSAMASGRGISTGHACILCEEIKKRAGGEAAPMPNIMPIIQPLEFSVSASRPAQACKGKPMQMSHYEFPVSRDKMRFRP